MTDYSKVKVGGMRLLKIRVGDNVVWEADPPALPAEPESEPPQQQKDTPDDR